MNIALDVAIVATTLAAAYIGLRTGMIRAGTAVAGTVAGVMLAKYSNPFVTPYVGRVFSDPEMAQAISVMAVVLGVLIASIVVGAVLRRAFQFLFLGWLDASAGAVAGFALLLMVWSAGLNVVVPNLNDELAGVVDRAPVAGTLMRKGPTLLEAAPGFVKDYAVARIPSLGTN